VENLIGPKTAKLITTLDDLGEKLDGLGHVHSVSWLAESARRLRSGDFSGIQHLLGAYGGMGSFNDLILPETTDQLRSDAYDLAHAIKQDVLA
jgi:hypothetical protein